MAIKIHYKYKDYGNDKKATEYSRSRAAERASFSPFIGIGIFIGIFTMADGISRKDFQIIIGAILIAGVIYYSLYSTSVSPIDDDIEIDNYQIKKYTKDQSIPQEQINLLNQKLEYDSARKKDETKKINQSVIKYTLIAYIVAFLFSFLFK